MYRQTGQSVGTHGSILIIIVQLCKSSGSLSLLCIIIPTGPTVDWDVPHLPELLNRL